MNISPLVELRKVLLLVEVLNCMYVQDGTFHILSMDKVTQPDIFLNTHGIGSYVMFPVLWLLSSATKPTDE